MYQNLNQVPWILALQAISNLILLDIFQSLLVDLNIFLNTSIFPNLNNQVAMRGQSQSNRSAQGKHNKDADLIAGRQQKSLGDVSVFNFMAKGAAMET